MNPAEDWDLFRWGEAFARSTDPDTSHEAAESVEGKRATVLEAQVLQALRQSPAGLTNHEIVDVTGLDWQSATPRVRPLVRKKLVLNSGEKRLCVATNRNCIVWKAVL